MRQGGGRFRFLPPPWIHPYLKRPKGSCPFWITRGSECLGFHILFGFVQGMPDDCKMADRRRKKRIGVSKKFRTYVHPYEHRPPDGCVSVCRGGHWPSAVKTKKIQHADANSQTQPGTNLHRRAAIGGDYTADEQCSPLHAHIGAGAQSRREIHTRLWW